MAAEMKQKEPIKCPHCDKELHGSVRAKMAEDATVKLTLTNERGHYIRAVTFGTVLCALEKLLRATAKEIGGNVIVFLTGLEMTETTITASVLVADAKKKEKVTETQP